MTDSGTDRLATLAQGAAGKPAAMFAVAALMRRDNREEEAVALAHAALRLQPDQPLATGLKAFIKQGVPPWHFTIVQDAARNSDYDAALQRAVRPGDRVLEIGTGTGLLSMMAARAGAAEVVTCEMSSVVAKTAENIIAANGYGDRIKVITGHSTRLSASDIGGRADILVSEIVSNDLLGEGVLPGHEHAVRELLKPGARVIPARGLMRVALAHDASDMEARLADVEGFDLTGLGSLAHSVKEFAPGSDRLSLRSEPADLFVFDFASSAYCAPGAGSVTCRSSGGQVNGIAQWIALDLDETTRYENRPGPGAKSCWGVLFHRLEHPLETMPGQDVRIFGAHDRLKTTIWLE